jgi:AcrR family transcriptional regulator
MDSTTTSAGGEDLTAAPSGRHELVLDEAARLLNSRGVLLTSLAEIAAKLGVSRSAMYYYVADRDDLVFQCYRRAAELIAERLDRAERSSSAATEMLKTFIANMLDPGQPEIAARAEIAMMSAKQRDTVQRLYDALTARIARIIEAGQQQGSLRSCDVDVNARIILSLLTWAPLAKPWADAVGPMGPARLLDAATATVFDGFSTSSALPAIKPIDLSKLTPRTINAFDRDGALEAKREALVRVASRLFNRKGIDSTSLDEIATQLGTTKRTLHHHLGSKQDLVSACYDRAFRIFMLIKDRMNDYQGSELEALCAAMHALALAYPADELSPLSPLVGSGALSEEGRERFQQNSAQLGDAYHQQIRRGIERGWIRDNIDVEARALMLPGLLSWLVKDDVPTDPAQHAHIAQEIANLVAVGLAVRS